MNHFRPMAALLLLASTSSAQVTERVNVGPNGSQSNGVGDLPQAGSFVSTDGRYVAFSSTGSNLVPGDTNGASDIFVRDRQTETVERVSVDSAGGQANGGWNGLYGLTMSPDGRFVAFYCEANNLVPGDTNGVADIILRDRVAGITERISVDSGGVQANGWNAYPSLSADGRFVAFQSDATNLVPGDTNAVSDIYVRDRALGITERISVAPGGAQANGESAQASISADGRFVAFYGNASNLVTGDTNGTWDVFVRDRLNGTTNLVSVPIGSAQFNMMSWGGTISSDGRYVAFVSAASNLVAGDTNGVWDVFVRDLQSGTTERVSVGPGGVQANGTSYPPFISADGRYVAFTSGATNIVPGITVGGIFVRDRRAGTTEYASASTNGVQPNGTCICPSISAGGRYVAFRGDASNLVPNDTNFVTDIFLHDRFASGFATLCDPGNNNVIACPCGNPPSAPGRGCDNSSYTGGASLSASGIAYLSIDSLVFTATNEMPTATSLLLQANVLIPNGLVFGQGVRCVGGALKRMYAKTAAGGSITAPDFNAGDPTISARSAFLGDPIQPGEARYYLVYYRDPIVLGGCPATSTFNATQTGSASWWP
jgi:Tol biopolymer transport system component